MSARRLFPLALVAFAAHSTVKPAGAAPALRPAELAPGVWALGSSARFSSANTGWVELGDRVLLIDPPHPDLLPKILAAVEATAGRPVGQVILTHGRDDAIEAAAALSRKGIDLAAAPAVAARVARAASADSGSAGKIEPIDGRLSVERDGVRLEAIAMGDAAGPGNIAVYLENDRLLFAGELCSNGPRADLARATADAWIAALERLRSLHPRAVVPGFGSPGGPELIERQSRFLRELRRQIAYLVTQKKPLEVVRERVRIDAPFLAWKPYDDPTPEDIAHLYRELTVPAAPFGAMPFAEGDKRPRALALIGDRVHYPSHIEEGLRRAFRRARIDARFAFDPRALSRENLSRVDLFVILRDGYAWPESDERPEVWMEPEQERAVAELVERGGALLALHNATGLYPEGGPYLATVGGVYDGHGPLERFRVRVTDAAHPIARGVASFEVADEQHTPIPDLARVDVFLESESEEGTKAAAGWVHEPGKGRVCYLANGHTREAISHPMVQRLLENAMLWCIRKEPGGLPGTKGE